MRVGSTQAIEALYASQHTAQRKTYAAFYSSELGGIVTDPALMVVQIDDHMLHRGHAGGRPGPLAACVRVRAWSWLGRACPGFASAVPRACPLMVPSWHHRSLLLDSWAVPRAHAPAVFDTALLVDGHLYQLDQHLERLLTSAARAAIPLPSGLSVEQMKRTILETAAASCKLNGGWRGGGRHATLRDEAARVRAGQGCCCEL